MHYKTGYCFVASDLYDNMDLKSLNIPKKLFTGKYKADTLREFCGIILTFCFYLIVLDIIENNVTFVLPLNGDRWANLYVKSFHDEEFQRMYRGGKFMGIDFLNSMFTGYQIYFQYKYRYGVRDKPVYINERVKKIFYDNVNNGKQYY